MQTEGTAETLGPLFTHPADLAEPLHGYVPFGLAVAAIAICILGLYRGRLGGFWTEAGIVFIPALAVVLGDVVLMERSKQTEFCGSCHVMEPVLESVLGDDGSLASFHVAEGIVPLATACFTCHSGYGLWGNFTAKQAGMGHMVAEITGRYDLPLKMRAPFDINSCLECHAETRKFRAVEAHQPIEIQEALIAREMGCAGMCHAVAHPPGALTGPRTRPDRGGRE